jgi:hypothetical protein
MIERVVLQQWVDMVERVVLQKEMEMVERVWVGEGEGKGYGREGVEHGKGGEG